MAKQEHSTPSKARPWLQSQHCPKHKLPAQARQCKPQHGGINLSRCGSLEAPVTKPKATVVSVSENRSSFVNLSMALKGTYRSRVCRQGRALLLLQCKNGRSGASIDRIARRPGRPVTKNSPLGASVLVFESFCESQPTHISATRCHLNHHSITNMLRSDPRACAGKALQCEGGQVREHDRRCFLRLWGGHKQSAPSSSWPLARLQPTGTPKCHPISPAPPPCWYSLAISGTTDLP